MTRAETSGGGSSWKTEGISPEIEEARALAGINSLDAHYRALARSPLVEVAAGERCPHSRVKVVLRSQCSLCVAAAGELIPISHPAIPRASDLAVGAIKIGEPASEPRRRGGSGARDGSGSRNTTPETAIAAFLAAIDRGVPQREPSPTSPPAPRSRAHKIDDAQLRKLWAEGLSGSAIATQLICSRETVRLRAIALGLHRAVEPPTPPEGFVTAREARKRLGDRLAAAKPHTILSENGRHARNLYAVAEIEQLEKQP